MESVLVKASAGSGKTTCLTQEVFKRILAGGKFITALTFTRAAITEMRLRIMKKTAGKEGITLLERLRLIMEAGRVGYSTIDSFFYRLYAAQGVAPKLADEKAQIELSGEIKCLFSDRVFQSGRAGQIIAAARILRTDMDTLWEKLSQEQAIEQYLLMNKNRIRDLDELMKENSILRNRLSALSQSAELLAGGVTSQVNNRVIRSFTNYENFISKTAAAYSDLEDYKSLGKNIPWNEKPYSDLNRIFRDYRQTAERLAVNKALLRELTVASLCEWYLETADAVKSQKGLIYFDDVRRALLALDGMESRERPRLMNSYFSLGLDRTEHLLMDEFQDTSKNDIAILLPLIDEILSGPGERGVRSFFAVGDWKQMIYGWRGADREALETAIGGYIEHNVIKESSLEDNYRSTPLLISFFNELVGRLFEGKEKTQTQNAPEQKDASDVLSEVNLHELEKNGPSQDPFYSAMVEYIKKKKSEYGCSWGDMAVLTLTNNHVQKIEATLRKSRIGVSTVKGRQLLSTDEGVAVMLFIAGVLARADQTRFDRTQAASMLYQDIVGGIDGLRTQFAAKYPRPFGFMAVAGALELLRGKVSATILDTWFDEAQDFFNGGGNDVDAFLQRMFNIRLSVKVPETEHSENIKVDTIHGTKGLQFRYVFVFWNEDQKNLPFYLEAEKCHVQFASNEIALLEASESDIARDIIESHQENLARLRREQANVFYVAATRAMQTLTVFLPSTKELSNKPVHQAVLDAFSRFAPGGARKEICRLSVRKNDPISLTVPRTLEKRNDEPEAFGEIDPTLLSASIKAGILRGERLHRWFARVQDQSPLPPAGELNDEEYAAALRFIQRSDVSAIIFRPGKRYVEKQISDKNNFGIVDRMIVSEDLITIIDYKSGDMRGLRQKYEEQMGRYTRIMEFLYPSRRVEYYILSIDGLP